ncbi:hypothetical protein [Nocardia sp. NPDC051570]|uniref:hypothetical protein n=1 Tax=Nocardia sp. NPDC051570 TaxID=3364324 RepID=UPI0037972AC6
MPRQPGSLSPAEARILQALNHGGMLTERQIKISASLTAWTTHQAISNLASRSLIVTGARPGRYEITRLGRNTLAARAPGYAR